MTRFRYGFTYATVEDIKSALDILETARAESQIRRVLRSATDSVEGLLKRRFYPEIRTQTFDWYDDLGTTSLPYTLWLDANEIISVTELESDGVISASDYYLKPDDGPPYTRIELKASTNATFDAGDANQSTVSLTGTFGFWDKEEVAGTITATINSSVTSLSVSNGALVGVGDLLKLGTERMVVTDRAFEDTSITIVADVTAASTASIQVSNGAGFGKGELISVNDERMLITDIVGSFLVVKRGWDGSALTSHLTGDPVYASRTLTVTRGVLGTTAAGHTNGDAVTRHYVPDLVRDLTIAEAMAQLLQERTAYARTIGKGDQESEVRGVGLADLRDRAVAQYGRRKTKARAA